MKNENYQNINNDWHAIRREAIELRKDKERLDWIEESGGRCGQLAEGGYFAHMAAQGDKYDSGATLREAIDAAMDSTFHNK